MKCPHTHESLWLMTQRMSKFGDVEQIWECFNKEHKEMHNYKGRYIYTGVLKVRFCVNSIKYQVKCVTSQKTCVKSILFLMKVTYKIIFLAALQYLVKYLPRMHEVWGFIPRTAKTNKSTT